MTRIARHDRRKSEALRNRPNGTSALRIVLVCAILGTGARGYAQPSVHRLTCGPDHTIGQALRTLKPGDTLLVDGVCDENVTIGPEFHRITLDGQGVAAINGDSSANSVTITGTGITIRGFVITGGAPQGIAVTDGASAIIDGNMVQQADRNGITVFRNSSADIINNTIQNSGLAGIAVQSSSSARIGWTGPAQQPDQRAEHHPEQRRPGHPDLQGFHIADLHEHHPEQREPWHLPRPQRAG